MRDLINNPLNPYATNWPNSFLKKGFQLGLRYNTIHFGVPSLRIKQLNKKIFLPPVYKVKYNQYTDNNKNLKTTEDIVTYYNKDKTIKSLNLYLNLKVKSEAEIMEEYKKKIINELNLIKKEKKKNEQEEDEEDEEEEEEEDDDDGEENDEKEDDEEEDENKNEEDENDEKKEEENENKNKESNENDSEIDDEENEEEEDV